MNKERGRRARGQPLLVFMALLLGWAGARVTSWGAEEGINLPSVVLSAGTATAIPAQSDAGFNRSASGPQSYPGAGYGPQPTAVYGFSQVVLPYWVGAEFAPLAPIHSQVPRGTVTAFASGHSPSPQYGPVPFYFGDVAHDGLMPTGRDEDRVYAAALPALPEHHGRLPKASQYGEAAALLGGRFGKLALDPARWSADSWALMRNDSGTRLPQGVLPATYGASQAGAVLRYRLSVRDSRRPTAYLRTTSTLGGTSETSMALGLSARPFPTLPIVGALEGRLTDQAGSRRVQPAGMVVTELPPIALPCRWQAEVYGQAGYVGDRYATPFADGQIRLDRRVLNIGKYDARLGAGAWGGAQKGAARLDAGPAAVLSLPLGPKVFGRIGLDYRFRIAGDAEPGSGPALTVGAGF